MIRRLNPARLRPSGILLGAGVLLAALVTPASAQPAATADAQPATTADAQPSAPRAEVEPQVMRQVQRSGDASFFVFLKERADLSGTANRKGKEKARHVYDRLRATADRSQAGLRRLLRSERVPFETFWISNAIKVTGDARLVNRLSARSDVARIEAERFYEVPKPRKAAEAPKVAAPEWGLTNVRAPEVWSDLGVRGEGVVVANIDTGVQWDHPALRGQYRGASGGSADHNYNWFDPTGRCGNTPCDNNNHGTHTMGTMVGDDGGSNQIGVAPRATWIAAKGCATNQCSSSDLLRSGEWMVAPTDLNGQNADPDKAPDVVNNSWGGGRGDTWYRDTINAWINAGIFPAFANGNSGSGCGTANSPGDNIEAYAVGAYDMGNNVASFSSRGPSGVSSSEIKPNIAAPGVSVRSSVAGNGYSSFSGTSMATPHVAGVVALVWSGAPSHQGDIDLTRELLDVTARNVSATGCGGTAEDNNIFGEGRVDAFAAVERAQGEDPGNRRPTARFTESCDDESLRCEFDASGSSDPDGEITAYAWDFGDGTTGSGVTAAHTYEAAGSHTVELTVTDDQGATGSVSKTITIGPNQAPTADFTQSCFGWPVFGCIFNGTSSSDPDGEVTAWSWEFGDGTTGEGEQVWHSYGQAGSFDVTLTVTDDRGATGSVTKRATVG